MQPNTLLALLPLLIASVAARPRPQADVAATQAAVEVEVDFSHQPQYEPAFAVQEVYARRLAGSHSASASASATSSAEVSASASASASTESSGGSWWGKVFGHGKSTSSAPTASATTSAKASSSGKHSSSGKKGSASVSAEAPAETTVKNATVAADTISSADGSFAEYLLQLHNGFREEYGAGNLTYNDTLASFAQKVAETCVYQHSNGSYGENIAAVSGHKAPLEASFEEWADEAKYYSWDQPGFTESTGHFTQLVWKDTTQVGCGVATCGPDTIFGNYNQNTTLVVCEYQTPGNVIVRGDPGAYFRLNVGKKQEPSS